MKVGDAVVLVGFGDLCFGRRGVYRRWVNDSERWSTFIRLVFPGDMSVDGVEHLLYRGQVEGRGVAVNNKKVISVRQTKRRKRGDVPKLRNF